MQHVATASTKVAAPKKAMPVHEQLMTHILDFKQVFQFDSPQIFQILKKNRKMQTRYKIFQKVTFFLTVFYHMLLNCSF
jgi:hypothetical protein